MPDPDGWQKKGTQKRQRSDGEHDRDKIVTVESPYAQIQELFEHPDQIRVHLNVPPAKLRGSVLANLTPDLEPRSLNFGDVLNERSKRDRSNEINEIMLAAANRGKAGEYGIAE